MVHLLHLDSSARQRSFSRALTQRFAATWRSANPTGTYAYRDLAADPVPPISPAWTEICDALMTAKITDIARYEEVVQTADQRAAWAVLQPLLAELVRADVVLIGSPMYNFGIPATLKAWIDQITFPRMSLAGRTFVVVTARGGSYQPGTPRAPYDYQERYLRDFLAGHMAVTDVTFVNSELTNTLVDPLIADLAPKQRASHQLATETVDKLALTLRPSGA